MPHTHSECKAYLVTALRLRDRIVRMLKVDPATMSHQKAAKDSHNGDLDTHFVETAHCIFILVLPERAFACTDQPLPTQDLSACSPSVTRTTSRAQLFVCLWVCIMSSATINAEIAIRQVLAPSLTYDSPRRCPLQGSSPLPQSWASRSE